MSTCDLTFHGLDLEVGVVDQLLLTLLLILQFADVGLQVAGSRQGARDIANQIGLLSPQFEQLLRFFEKLFFLSSGLFFDLSHHVFRFLEFVLGVRVRLLQSHLEVLFLVEAFFGSVVAFLCGIQTLHLFFQNFVDVGHVGALVLQLGREGRQLVAQNHHFALQRFLFFIRTGERLADLGQLTLLLLNSRFSAAVIFLLALKARLVSLQLGLLVVEVVLVHTESLALVRDQGVAAAGVLNGFLPLEVELMALLVETFEFLGCFVKLDLSGLGFSNLLLQLAALAANLNGELLDLEGELLDLGLVSASVLLESEVVLLLLAGSEGPLFELLLVPVHFQLKLVHLLVGLEDHVLDVVQAVLLVRDPLLKLLNLVLESA